MLLLDLQDSTSTTLEIPMMVQNMWTNALYL